MEYNQPGSAVYLLAERLLQLVESWKTTPLQMSRRPPPGWEEGSLTRYVKTRNAAQDAEDNQEAIEQDQGSGANKSLSPSGNLRKSKRSSLSQAPGIVKSLLTRSISSGPEDTTPLKRRRLSDSGPERASKRLRESSDTTSPSRAHRSLFASQDSLAALERLKSLYEHHPPKPESNWDGSRNVKVERHREEISADREDVSGNVESYHDDSYDDDAEMRDEDGSDLDAAQNGVVLHINLRSVWEGTRRKERLTNFRHIPAFQHFFGGTRPVGVRFGGRGITSEDGEGGDNDDADADSDIA